jgi:exopolysaccharide biosynthesis protein
MMGQDLKKQISFWIIAPLLFVGRGQSIAPMEWAKIEIKGTDQISTLQYFESKKDLAFSAHDSEKFKAYYAIVDANDPLLEIRTSMSKQPVTYNEFLANTLDKLILIVNGGFFGPNTSYSLVIANHQVLAKNATVLKRETETFLVSRPAFFKDALGNYGISWVYTDSLNNTFVLDEPLKCTAEESTTCLQFLEDSQALPMEMAIGGGPILIKNGLILEDYSPEHFLEDVISSKAPRTAIGLTPDHKIVFLVVDGRQEHSDGVSLPILAALLKNLGCEYAMNLDGGSSSFLASGDSVINQPSKNNPPQVSSFISIALKQSTD